MTSRLAVHDYPRCYLRGRLTFVGAAHPAPFPSAIYYLGPRVKRFAATFGRLGRAACLAGGRSERRK